MFQEESPTCPILVCGVHFHKHVSTRWRKWWSISQPFDVDETKCDRKEDLLNVSQSPTNHQTQTQTKQNKQKPEFFFRCSHNKKKCNSLILNTKNFFFWCWWDIFVCYSTCSLRSEWHWKTKPSLLKTQDIWKKKKTRNFWTSYVECESAYLHRERFSFF